MTRVVVPESDQSPTYVLLLLRQPAWMDDKDYRPFRQGMLLPLRDAAKVRFPKALDIVGIACDHPQPGADFSEDVCYLDAREWTDEDHYCPVDEQRAACN